MPRKIIIEVGDPQPIDCSKCNRKHGYQFSDLMKIHYTTIFEENGDHWGGCYSEGGSMLNEGVTPYCANCGTKLSFKLKR